MLSAIRHGSIPVIALLCVIGVQPCLGASSADGSDLSAAVHDLRQTAFKLGEISTDQMRASAVARIYDESFGAYTGDASRLDRIPPATLGYLFQATQLAAFYTWRDRDTTNLVKIYAALEKRGIATRKEGLETYQALVAARRFKQADAIAAAHPSLGLHPLPKVVDEASSGRDGPAVLAVALNKPNLVRRRIDIDQPALIVVLAEPHCHFARNGIGAIEADPVLGRIFRDHAVWLAPPEGHLYFSTFQKWNRTHPDAKMVLAVTHRDWPMLDTWALPTFYFLQNGYKVAEVIGWTGPAEREVLTAAARSIGLLKKKPSR